MKKHRTIAQDRGRILFKEPDSRMEGQQFEGGHMARK